MIPAPAEASFGRSTVPSAFVFAAHVLLTLITAFEIGLPSAVTFSFSDGALASISGPTSSPSAAVISTTARPGALTFK